MSKVSATPPGEPVLTVRDLDVSFWVDGEWHPAARGVNFEVAAGEIVAIVGESGSGKTQTSMSLLGLLPANGRASGSATLRGQELIGLRGAALRRTRGREIAVIFQEPMTALNPVYTIGFQIVETLRSQFPIGPTEAKTRAIELLRMVEIPEPEARFDSFPHQLSGGQRQRAMIAMALACEPALLIADEPTTALDVTVQAEILALLRDLRTRISAGIVLITHDMGVVADLADRMVVMQQGRVVETGTTREVFAQPAHAYTQKLLTAVPHFGSVVAGEPTTAPAQISAYDPIVRAENLILEYPKQAGQAVFQAVKGVSFDLQPGEVLGLVGESGSGKTTIGRAIVGLMPVAAGTLEVAGVALGAKPGHLPRRRALIPLRRKVGIVFQDPSSSLNPRLPIGESIGEPLLLHRNLKGAALSREVEALLDSVQLPRAYRNRYPHELSGGQKQRVGIARALALRPELMVADEPTSALDVSVQAKVLELFAELQREQGFACLFISHDFGVIESVATRIAVLRFGELVEIGPRAQVINQPQHEYTQRLVAAVPVPDPGVQAQRRAHRDALIRAAGVS